MDYTYHAVAKSQTRLCDFHLSSHVFTQAWCLQFFQLNYLFLNS